MQNIQKLHFSNSKNCVKLHFSKCKIRFVSFEKFFMINIFCFKKDLYICQTIK